MEKIYFYIICLLTFFVLMWGAIDFVSAGITYLTTPALSTTAPQPQQSLERAEVNFDAYYQRKVAQDRLADSVARILIAGAIFAFCRYRLTKMEVD
jgi:hypothetical protein